MKKFLKLLLNKIGLYTKKQTKQKKDYFNFLNGVIYSFINNEERINIVQIGANDGVHGDPLHEFIKKYHKKINLIAIEPQIKAYEELKENYKGFKNIYFFNGCIGDGKDRFFYSLNDNFKKLVGKKDIKIDGVSSFEKQNLIRRLETYKIKNYEKYLKQEKIKSHLLTKVIIDLDFDPTKIHLLQIDAEGYDDQVIYNSEIQKNHFRFINYEFKNLSEERITNLHDYLHKSGYEVLRWNKSDEIAIKQ